MATKTLIDRIIECLAGPTNQETATKTDRILEFMAKERSKADDPDSADFDDLLRAVSEHEELNAEFDDVTAHIFERLGVSDPEMEEDDEFNIALEQFFDIYLTNRGSPPHQDLNNSPGA